MKILMYSHMGKGKGGGEQVFERICDRLKSSGFEVVKIFGSKDVKEGHFEKEKEGWHINLYIPKTWKLFFHIPNLKRVLISIYGLFRMISNIRPDVVNYHFFTSESVYFALLKWVFGYRFVVSCHGSDVLNIDRMQQRVAPFVLWQANSITCVSQALAKKLRKHASTVPLIHVIYNGVDYAFWQDGDVGKDQGYQHRLVSVGALKSVKGHDVLLEAFRRIVSERPGLTLQIVGDGPRRCEYETFVGEANLDDQIDISGWYTREEVRTELRKASVFVFPSRHEGFGIALVEAMAAGCPVIASETGGIPEVVRDTGAILVPPGSPAALAGAIEEALDNREWRKKSGRAAAQRASQLDWRSSLDEYEKRIVGR